MNRLLLILAFLNTYNLCLYGIDKQSIRSGSSGNAGASATAACPPTKDMTIAPARGPVVIAISNENELTSEQKAEIERISSELSRLGWWDQKNARKKSLYKLLKMEYTLIF